jgi:hypothetical protein
MVLSFWMCFPCVSILLGEWFFLSGCVFLVFLFYLENGSFFLDVLRKTHPETNNNTPSRIETQGKHIQKERTILHVE